MNWISKQLDQIDRQGLRRRLSERAAAQGPVIEIDGRSVVNFGSNDYLGLAGDPRLAGAVRQALDTHGWGAGASPLVTGRSTLHAELERRIAELKNTQAALLFPSGFAANAGVVPALADHGDAILSDAKNHASLIDGCRLSRAQTFVYPHSDTRQLESLLQQTASHDRRLIVTDTLFSMDGDFAPLAEITELANRHDAMVLVDEAHATGVWGERGSGLVEHLGVEQEIEVRVGTLSKALGASGGFVAGSQELIDLLANRARSYVFSTAMPAANCAAALASLEIVRHEPERRRRVLTLADRLRDQLRGLGLTVGASQSQVVPIVMGQIEPTLRLAERLREEGLFVPAIRPPTVPEGESLLRVSLTAAHTDEQVEQLTRTLRTSL